MKTNDRLMVIWSSGDAEVALKVCFMYTHAARLKGWFGHIVLVVWGPSARLVVENEKVRNKLLAMKSDGVVVEACVRCAEMYNIAPQLKGLGFDVKPMGELLTERVKEGWNKLHF